MGGREMADRVMDEIRVQVGEKFLHENNKRCAHKDGEVVMIFRRPGGKVLLSTKSFYLKDIYRLPTGSIEKGEKPEDALKREIYEETGFRMETWEKIGEIHWMFSHGQQTGEYFSHVYVMPESTAEPVCMDKKERISGYIEVDVAELPGVCDRLMRLPARWRDWGEFRGLVHTYVHKRLTQDQRS